MDRPATEVRLEEAELFRSLDAEWFPRLRSQLREEPLERHRVIFVEGQDAARLWVLRRGEVRLYKTSHDGRITTLETLGPGCMFGALSSLDEERYPMSAEAILPGVAWTLPRAAFLGLLAEQPAVALEVLRVVSGRLRDAHERLRSFAHDPAPRRLAGALLRAARGGEAHVTRRALAEACGTTTETAIRVLRRFEREGLIRGEVGRVRVLDEASLHRIAGER